MKFHLEEGELLHRRISENGLIEIGVYPVIYGYRIRAGFAGYMVCELDWCAGADWERVNRLYSIMMAILGQRPEGPDCFDDLPSQSRVKPFYNDQAFTDFIVAKAGPLTDFKLPRPDRV